MKNIVRFLAVCIICIHSFSLSIEEEKNGQNDITNAIIDLLDTEIQNIPSSTLDKRSYTFTSKILDITENSKKTIFEEIEKHSDKDCRLFCLAYNFHTNPDLLKKINNLGLHKFKESAFTKFNSMVLKFVDL